MEVGKFCRGWGRGGGPNAATRDILGSGPFLVALSDHLQHGVPPSALTPGPAATQAALASLARSLQGWDGVPFNPSWHRDRDQTCLAGERGLQEGAKSPHASPSLVQSPLVCPETSRQPSPALAPAGFSKAPAALYRPAPEAFAPEPAPASERLGEVSVWDRQPRQRGKSRGQGSAQPGGNWVQTKGSTRWGGYTPPCPQLPYLQNGPLREPDNE